MLKKQTQLNILSWPEKKVKINKTIVNKNNLKANGLKVIWCIIIALQIRLDKFHNPLQIRLDKS